MKYGKTNSKCILNRNFAVSDKWKFYIHVLDSISFELLT